MKIYGEEAKNIKQGDVFIATIFSVEGKTVVELIPKEKYIESQAIENTQGLIDKRCLLD